MAYNVGDGAILQVTFEGSLFGQQVMNVFSFRMRDTSTVLMDGAAAIALAQSAVNFATTGLYSRWRQCVSVNVVGIIQTYQWIAPLRYRAMTLIPTARTGAAGECLAPNLGTTITRTSEQADRRGVSNTHIPGLPTTMVEGGIVNADLVDNLNALVTAALEPMVLPFGHTLVPVAYHKAEPEDSRQLTTGYAHNTSRDMRRRTVGVGS